jgi:hypothetical protein
LKVEAKSCVSRAILRPAVHVLQVPQFLVTPVVQITQTKIKRKSIEYTSARMSNGVGLILIITCHFRDFGFKVISELGKGLALVVK